MTRVLFVLFVPLFVVIGALNLYAGDLPLGLGGLVLGLMFLLLALRRRAGAAPAAPAAPTGFAGRPWFRLALWALFAAFVVGGLGWMFAPAGDARFPLAVVVASFVGLLGLSGASAVHRWKASR